MPRGVINIKDYLAKGQRKSKTECPLALASMEVSKQVHSGHGNVTKIEVVGNRLSTYFEDGYKITDYLPAALVAAIKQYDETGIWPDECSEIHYSVNEPKTLFESIFQPTHAEHDYERS